MARMQRTLVATVATVLLGGALALGAVSARPTAQAASATPWDAAETVTPAALAAEMAHAKAGAGPVVVCAGFQVLYRGGHVPGAAYAGPASQPEGLAALKKWAAGRPRSANVVVYCGCCPMTECPNIRPAFEALHAMGFTHLRVLLLPDSFGKDWVGQGLPVARGD